MLVLVVVVGCGGSGVASSRVWLDDSGAYRDVVVAVHPNFVPSNCTLFFGNLKVMLQCLSLYVVVLYCH